MKKLSIALATAALVGLVGCAPAASAPTNQPPQSGATSAQSSTASAPAASPPTSAGVSSIAPHGKSSTECIAASTVTLHITGLAQHAKVGKVTTADVDKAFGGRDYTKLPADAKPHFEAVKVLAEKLVGLDATAAAASSARLSAALDDVAQVTRLICA